tara:strand:- start:18 stop:407 length:390 start_codon:yes stop_codon:yes gene_type:complete
MELPPEDGWAVRGRERETEDGMRHDAQRARVAFTHLGREPGSGWRKSGPNRFHDGPWDVIEPGESGKVASEVVDGVPGDLQLSKGFMLDDKLGALEAGAAEEDTAISQSDLVTGLLGRGLGLCEDEAQG